MERRLLQISKKLAEYAVGKFDSKALSISAALDETDAMMSAINMLGEELKAITISRNYFNNIFNSVSDMLLLVNRHGAIVDCNLSAQNLLQYSREELTGMKMQELFTPPLGNVRQLCAALKNDTASFQREEKMSDKNGRIIPVSLRISILQDGTHTGLLLLTATDITYQLTAENLIIRTIINTQEMERQRLAKDLHDSLAQQLSGSIYYITTTAHSVRSKQHKKALGDAEKILQEVMTEIRNACFNLMPGTLRQFGLVKAINELCHHFLNPTHIAFKFKCPQSLPVFSKELQIDIYRVMQELISNVIKHAMASLINIRLVIKNNLLSIYFSDNGRGFDTSGSAKGMGLQNVASRIKSYHGNVIIKSSPGKGTRYFIHIPFLNQAI